MNNHYYHNNEKMLFRKLWDMLCNIVMLFIVIYLGRASILSEERFAYLIIILLLIMAILKGKTIIDSKLIIIFIIWGALNLLAILSTNSEILILRVLKYFVIMLFLPYLALKVIGVSFWDKFEKIVYSLTLISIPLFVLNSLFPDYFNSLADLFRPFTHPIYNKFNPHGTYWSAFIYGNAVREGGLYRNSAFMWEPGGFAMIVVWATIFNILNYGTKVKKKYIIYGIALITTFSTAGFLAFPLAIAAFTMKKLSIKNIAIFAVYLFIFTNYTYRYKFVGGEINDYIYQYRENTLAYNLDVQAIKVNRIMMLKYGYQKILKNPMGYGVISEKDYDNPRKAIVGVNGVIGLLVIWGIPIFIFIAILLWNYIIMNNIQASGITSLIMLYLSLLIMIFSNPVERSILVYLILFSPLIFKRYRKNEN